MTSPDKMKCEARAVFAGPLEPTRTWGDTSFPTAGVQFEYDNAKCELPAGHKTWHLVINPFTGRPHSFPEG